VSVATTRVQRTVPATLTHTFYVGETAVDPTGTPTVAIVAADAVAVQSGNGVVAGGSTGRVTFAMNAVATLEYLTVTWTATVSGVARTEVDYVQVVGGFAFTLTEGRASDETLSDANTYTAAALEVARFEVEAELEAICDRAFTPQYQRVVLDGTGESDVVLEHSGIDRTPSDIRTIRSITMADRADGTFTAFTAGHLAAVQVTEDMRLMRVDGTSWTEGLRNIVVEYEYGLDAPPLDLKRASMVRLLYRLNIHRQSQPENALSYQVDGGGTYRLDMPDRYKVGIPGIDAIYGRYSRRPESGTGDNGGGGRPASRTFSYQPQRFSLYHG
jgi:hypothetical protein